MLKQSAMLEVKIGDRIYSLSLPNDAPLGEAYDALFEMRSYVISRINDAHKADETKKEEEQPKVE